jgi:NADPH:quinone reductase-like Zn-dependent oxidoreductase
VYGASGTAGTIAVQVLKERGAHVTGVCGPAHLDLVRSLGADAVLDYTSQDALEPGERFDLVLDAVGGTKGSRLKQACRAALSPGGGYVSIDDAALQLDSGRLASLNRLIEAGQVKPVLDRTFPLTRMAEAHAYAGAGHKQGGVAITV